MPATMRPCLASGAIYFGLEKKLSTFSNALKGKKKEETRAKKRGKKTVAIPPPFFLHNGVIGTWNSIAFPAAMALYFSFPPFSFLTAQEAQKSVQGKERGRKDILVGKLIHCTQEEPSQLALAAATATTRSRKNSIVVVVRTTLPPVFFFFAKINAVVLATRSAKQQRRLHLSRHGSLIKGPCEKKVWELNYSPFLQK